MIEMWHGIQCFIRRPKLTDQPGAPCLKYIETLTFSRTTFYVLVLKVFFDVLPMNATGSQQLKPEIVEVILYFGIVTAINS